MIMNFADFNDPVKNECEGKKPVYLDKNLLVDFVNFCRKKDKDPQSVCEYFLKLGIHTDTKERVFFDVDNL